MFSLPSGATWKPRHPDPADGKNVRCGRCREIVGEIVVSRMLSLFIRCYRYGLSPMFGMQCRFYPSCSAYALEAIERHGAARGAWIAIKRVARCHPWHPGGCDPIP